VRVLALDIISQTARSTAPAALKPLLPGLVQAMLEGLSSLEDSRCVHVHVIVAHNCGGMYRVWLV